MSIIKGYYKFMLGTMCALLIAACGGGGGGGSSGGLTYTGLITPAAITATNGKEIATTAFMNSDAGAAIGTTFAAVSAPDNSENSGAPHIFTVVQVLAEMINKIDLTTISLPSLSRATYTKTDTISGSCGGSAQYTITVNDATYDSSGSFTYTNYCEAGDTVNGVMSISGEFNPNTNAFGNLTVTFTTLTISSSKDSFTIDGNITTNPSTTPIVATTNMKMKDNATRKVFWVENHISTIDKGVNSLSIGLSGRFYHPDYGYVDLTTPTHFFIADTDDWPSSGEMTVTGAASKKVTLTVISNTTYNIEIDADANDVYETQQLGLLWADL